MDNETRLQALENFCFSQNNDFQTKAFEAVQNSLEAGLPLGVATDVTLQQKRISKDMPMMFSVYSKDKGIGLPVITDEKLQEIVPQIVILYKGVLVYNNKQRVMNVFDGTYWVPAGVSRATTVVRDTYLNPAPGMLVFNINTGKINMWDSVGWVDMIDSNAMLFGTQPFVFEQLTTAQRNAIVSPAFGRTIYNTTTNKLNVYTGTWEQITSV